MASPITYHRFSKVVPLKSHVSLSMAVSLKLPANLRTVFGSPRQRVHQTITGSLMIKGGWNFGCSVFLLYFVIPRSSRNSTNPVIRLVFPISFRYLVVSCNHPAECVSFPKSQLSCGRQKTPRICMSMAAVIVSVKTWKSRLFSSLPVLRKRCAFQGGQTLFRLCSVNVAYAPIPTG